MKKFGCALGALVVASCGFPRPADVPGDDADDGSGSMTCQLTAIGPSLANTDDPLTLEGTFLDVVTVNFPGGTSLAATMLGPHRARVNVPASATAGDLTVTTCGLTLGPLPFRRASFALGVGTFASNYEQTTGARQYPTLAVPRDSHTSTVVGHQLYVVGGVGRSGALNSVEHALINADGSLGRFTIVPGVTLVTPRQAHTAVVIGDQLYVIGGFGNGSLSSVEHATIAPDGSLGPFTNVSDISLMTARQGHTSAVVGNFLYVLGGVGASTLNSVERAIIHADGSLGPFAVVPDVKLATARHGHTTAVIANYLYVLGGAGKNGAMRDIERAVINPDGSLGPFMASTSSILATERSGHTAAVLGRYLYVLGGVGASFTLSTVERAPIDADGSLGGFAIVSDVTMLRGRHGHTTTARGNYLYVLGGSDDLGLLDREEHATLNVSGALGSFAHVPGVVLTTERADPAGVVLGSYFYVIGGLGGSTTIERALINADGSLEPFAPIPELTLARPHDGHTVAVIGNYLYALGGGDKSVERATIGPDGSLGAFEVVSAALITARTGATSSSIGNYLYVVGGNTGPGDAGNVVERTFVNTDGSLAGFQTVSGVSTTVRSFHTSPLIANYIYLIGGSDLANGTTVKVADRALLNFNGALGSFETVPAVTMGTVNPRTAVIGSSLYAIDGASAVERATISANVDAPLSTFVTIPDITGTFQSGPATAIVENYVYVVGGSGGRVLLNTVSRGELK